MKIKPGVIISNRYEIIEQIGSGGMSIVYKAKDRRLGRVVTFKVLRAEYVKDIDFVKRFEVEARAAASLSHPNIVNVYDVGHDGLVNYIVMEYIDGVTLKEIIKRRAPFDNDEILGVAVQIASALEHAHNNNVVHRDIKPQNILVTSNGVVKVADFGIAKASSNKTIKIANNTMGSVHYFSPEQAKGGYVSFKSDIYSLGIIMFEMATGKLPFDDDTPVAIAIKQINESLPDVRELNNKIDIRIQKIIERATEKFASRRYSSAGEMEEDLKRALVNESVLDEDSFEETSATIQLSASDIEKIKKETGKFGGEDEFYDLEDDLNDLQKERKVVIAAVITSMIIISVISFFGYRIFFGHKQVSVPQLLGKTLQEANVIAKQIGVQVREVGKEYNDEVEKDKISSQNYSDGDNLYEGDTIDVKISLGVEQIHMPDVRNKDLSDAYEAFKDCSFDVEEIYEFSSSVPNNIVIKQKPSAGTMVDSNAQVVLHISRGREVKNVTVPNLVGMTESEAKVTLQANDLVIGSVTKAESKDYDAGLVIKQTVGAGTEVQAETIVGFVVSSGYVKETPEVKEEAKTDIKTEKENGEKVEDKSKTDEKIESDTASEVVGMKVLTVDPKNIPLGAEKVELKILRVSANGAEVFYDEKINVSELPKRFSITRENAGEYQVYLVDDEGNSSYQWSTTISF